MDEPLDLFSTSQRDGLQDLHFQAQTCAYNAPFFAYEMTPKKYGVTQGNCHHWDCPKCGIGRAKQEYGRIVNGAREIASQGGALAFLTITCRGAGLTKKEADAHYGEWTNHLLTILRTDAKETEQAWFYVQVTERQKRGLPHSHLLTTYMPCDVHTEQRYRIICDNSGQRRREYYEALRSPMLGRAVLRAHLGEQYDVSRVQSVEAASRYVAKYMFKPSIFLTDWPKGWKRVRYSQGWPKLPKAKTDAFVLLSRMDWTLLQHLAVVIQPTDEAALAQCRYWLQGSDIIIDRVTKPTENSQVG